MTTLAPTTVAPTSAPGDLPAIACGRIFRSQTKEGVVRAWCEDSSGSPIEWAYNYLACEATLFDEKLEVRSVVGERDPAAAHIVRFVWPGISGKPGTNYLIRVHLVRDDDVDLGEREFSAGTT